MAGDTVITVIGNLTGDPELRYTLRVRRLLISRSHRLRVLLTARRTSGRMGRPCSCVRRCGVVTLRMLQRL